MIVYSGSDITATELTSLTVVLSNGLDTELYTQIIYQYSSRIKLVCCVGTELVYVTSPRALYVQLLPVYRSYDSTYTWQCLIYKVWWEFTQTFYMKLLLI